MDGQMRSGETSLLVAGAEVQSPVHTSSRVLCVLPSRLRLTSGPTRIPKAMKEQKQRAQATK